MGEAKSNYESQFEYGAPESAEENYGISTSSRQISELRSGEREIGTILFTTSGGASSNNGSGAQCRGWIHPDESGNLP